MKKCRMRALDWGNNIPCPHLEMVLDYRAERQRQEIAAENDYRNRDGNERAEPLITFKEWLEGRASFAEAERLGYV